MRRRIIREKVKTKFGSMYATLELDKLGRPCGLSFSTPGKLLDSELDDVIRLLGEAAGRLIGDATGEQK